MKKIFIHAGPGKTGTSTIQHWLSRNVDLLAENGIHYPHHDIDSNGVSPGNYDAVLSQDENKTWVVDEVKTKKLLKYFEGSQWDTLVLSSEILIGQLEDLLDLMPNAETILYLRNPLEVMESNYNQLVKRHRHTEKFKAKKNQLFVTIKRFSQLLENRKENKFIIRPYYKNKPNYNVLEDILKIIDPSFDIKINYYEVNNSYPIEILEVKRILNQYKIDKIDNELDVFLQSLPNNQKEYSLIQPLEYKELKNQMLLGLRLFIDKYKLKPLTPLVTDIESRKQPEYKEHYITKGQIISILEKLSSSKPNLLNDLLGCISNIDKETNSNPVFNKTILEYQEYKIRTST